MTVDQKTPGGKVFCVAASTARIVALIFMSAIAIGVRIWAITAPRRRFNRVALIPELFTQPKERSSKKLNRCTWAENYPLHDRRQLDSAVIPAFTAMFIMSARYWILGLILPISASLLPPLSASDTKAY